MSDTPETLDAIIQFIRNRADNYRHDGWESVADELEDLADHIEAAVKRERVELREDEAKMLLREYAAAPDESLTPSALELKRELLRLAPAPGNVAALREALEGCMHEMCERCDSYMADNIQMHRPCPGCVIVDKARDALSAPARNCDRFKTLDEAREAFQDLRGHKILADVELWDSMDEAGALVRWLFAPAEGGAE